MALYSEDELKKVLAKHDEQVNAYKESSGIAAAEQASDIYHERQFEYAKMEQPKANMEHFSQIYRSKDFTRAMNEYFDVTDDTTRKILLSVNEADQDKIMVSLTSKLYDAIMDKVDSIDFGEIPESKGDITRVPNISKVLECLDTMKELLVQYNQPTDPIDTVLAAYNNIAQRRDTFQKAFRYKIELPMVLYNTIVLSIITATTYMISTTISFIKTPNSDTFQITLDRAAMTKSKQHMVFTNLKRFNEACQNGEVDKSLDYIIRNNVKNLTGVEFGVIAGGIAVVALLFSIIPIIRELIFFTYYTRVRVSEYFDTQATLLQMNASNLEANKTLDKTEKEKIVKKQSKIADFFRSISNKIAVKCKTAENEATKDLVSSNKKYKTDEVLDSVPDSAGSVLF